MIPNYDSGEFDSGESDVTSTSVYQQILLLSLPRKNSVGIPVGELAILGEVTGGANLAHLKLTAAVTAGGTHVDLLEDTDFDTATTICPHAGPDSPPTIHQTAAGDSFNLLLQNIGAYAEIALWAKKASGNTAVSTTGRYR